MLPLPVGREAASGVGAPVYVRHRPERTLLYQLVQEYYPELKAHLEAQGTALPGYVEQKFEAYLKCGRLEHGFLRVRCDNCHAEHLVAFSCKRRGFCPSCGARRMAESAAALTDARRDCCGTKRLFILPIRAPAAVSACRPTYCRRGNLILSLAMWGGGNRTSAFR